MTTPPNDSLTNLHSAVTASADQINETAAALREAARLLSEGSLFPKPAAALQAQINDSWLPLIDHLQAQMQLLGAKILREREEKR